MARRIEEPESSSIPTTIGVNLARLRKERALTQEQLAERAGISRATIIKLEGGSEPNPKAATIADLETALGVEAGALSSNAAADARAVPVSSEGRISLSQFLAVARGVLDKDDIARLERLRTRFDPRGLTKRAWLRTVIDMREDEDDGDVG